MNESVFDAICSQAFSEYPLEMCGLIAGPLGDCPGKIEHQSVAMAYYPCRNVAESATRYIVDPRDHLAAERAAEEEGWELLGVVHSHTHSEPFPSPTDIADAPDPEWHYVIVSLKRDAPELRSYRIVDGSVAEEPVALGES